MLKLCEIKKDYPAGENTVHALKGISLEFRKSEFVSILGPSGCGKTTMLNIIGGLDQYTSGDLVIDGVSTKNFGDRDWDAYRNHSIGFVFQSYNLIPHQTVLQNVELALTLSGVGKKERRERAVNALKSVGLGDQLKKKPSEMSGGQMQRVAIARALVNNPDIILADEPTGALDTETSVSVMDILKEVAKERLVIMVTHNPELAEKYSTRIIKMLDGNIISDSMPTEETAETVQTEKKVKNVKKPSMSFFTAFSLSLKNLFTKKARTLLTSFAGSIGIIGIALIFAVSQGTSAFINAVQEDTLTSYPLTLQATSVDITTLMETFMGQANTTAEHGKDAVYSQAVMFEMINALNNIESNENDLKSFKTYLGSQIDSDSKLNDALSGISYTYNLDLLVYTKNVDGEIIKCDTRELLSNAIAENFGMSMGGENGNAMPFSSLMGSGQTSMSPMGSMNLWNEMLSGKGGSPINPVLKEQYDVIYGEWPKNYNEIVLVVNENNELDDLTLYALGLKSKSEIDSVFDAVKNGTTLPTETKTWSYEEICNTDFKVILNSSCYTKNEATGLYTDLRQTEAGLKYLYDNAISLKVTGILRKSENATSAMLTGSIGYTKQLTEHIINESLGAECINSQLTNPEIDVFNGLPFKENTGNLTDTEKKEEFKKYIEKLDTNGKANAYIKIMSIPKPEQIEAAVNSALKSTTREQTEKTVMQALSSQTGMNNTDVSNYIKAMNDEELNEVYAKLIEASVKAQTAAAVQKQLSGMPKQNLAMLLTKAMNGYTDKQFATYYDEVLDFSESDLDTNLLKLGCIDLNSPASINLYASSFENKEIIEDCIKEYNESVEELKQIEYTDYVGLMMSSVTIIIDAITYILIAFVAISLIVSSIMIGVITLISVQERTKEIGILRAIGASKANVSSMFNAETVIIGFSSGLIGILTTYLLLIPINAIIQSVTGIMNLKAYLPISVALILIAISMLLTLISGIIPSRSAAKKDPVVALRTE